MKRGVQNLAIISTRPNGSEKVKCLVPESLNQLLNVFIRQVVVLVPANTGSKVPELFSCFTAVCNCSKL